MIFLAESTVAYYSRFNRNRVTEKVLSNKFSILNDTLYDHVKIYFLFEPIVVVFQNDRRSMLMYIFKIKQLKNIQSLSDILDVSC